MIKEILEGACVGLVLGGISGILIGCLVFTIRALLGGV